MLTPGAAMFGLERPSAVGPRLLNGAVTNVCLVSAPTDRASRA
jgi:hypothetical protein